MLAACSDNELTNTLSGEGKTPLTVTAVLDASSRASQSRAADKEFSSDGDELKVMLRHVTWTGYDMNSEGHTYDAENDKPKTIANDKSLISKLVTFKAKGNTDFTGSDRDILPFSSKDIGIAEATTKQAASLEVTDPSALYWDDFSVGGMGDDTDIRTEGHYLQSYYGYCYNGGTPDTGKGLDTDDQKAAGKIDWTIQTDQTTNNPTNFQKSDLLWSPAQRPVRYDHKTGKDEEHGQVLVPFLHAMSKVTINVTAGIGFDGFNFTNTSIDLKSVRTKCTANAPEAELTYPNPEVKGGVKMMKGTLASGKCDFKAIIVPSVLTIGNTFATINMDGNIYNIPVTAEMLAREYNAEYKGWGYQLDEVSNEDVDHGTAQKPASRTDVPIGKGYQMRSGVHYVLNVSVSKTGATVSATILDWEEVEAEGVGIIHFDNNIEDKGDIAEVLKEHGFDVYKTPDAANYGTRATNVYWNNTQQVWRYKPTIYWDGRPEYFRALSNARTDAEGTADKNESLIMENDRDVLWGTTEAYTWGIENIAKGGLVHPRTGDVALVFEHPMSKITINLKDANAGGSDAATLDLRGATIQLTDLATGGTLNLHTGEITPNAITSGQKTFSEDKGAIPSRMGYFAANDASVVDKDELKVMNYVITPQNIGNDALITITLADGSIYKAQLNTCTTKVIANGTETYPRILKWESGKHYTYEITLGKEDITFRALVEPWVPVEGGGKATLDWD